MITDVTEVEKKDVEEVHQDLKYSYLSSYMLKPTSLLTHRFKDNKKAQGNLFHHMCNFGARAVWRNGRTPIRSYIDIDSRKYKYLLIKPNPLDFIVGYTMEVTFGDRALKRLPQRRLNLIKSSI